MDDTLTQQQAIAETEEQILDLDSLFNFDDLKPIPKREPRSPEDVLFSLIENNGFVYWLRAQLLQFKFLREDGIHICRDGIQNGTVGKFPIKQESLAKSLIEYYLLSTFSTRFDPARGLDQSLLCSLSSMTERLMNMEKVRQLLAGTFRAQSQNYLDNPAKKMR